jgi:hypothetical protein
MSDVHDRLRALDAVEAPEQWSEIEGRRPGSPVRVDHGPGGRVATVVVALAVATAGTFFAVDRFTPRRDEPVASLDVDTWRTVDIATLGVSFRYPPQWHVQHFDELVGRAGFTGAVVSNVRDTFRHPDLGSNEHTSAWDLRGLPSDSVVISIERVTAIAMKTDEADSMLPLLLEEASVQNSRPRYAPEGWERRWLPFVLGGSHDTLQIGIGPEATDHDREVARLIVASIAPLGPESFDGWTVDVRVDYDPTGQLEVEVGPIQAAAANDAKPWVQHELILRNTGDDPLHFDDTRTSKFIGLPHSELLAADQGCGYASSSPDTPIKAGACLSYLDEFSIPPHGTEERTVTLSKGLRGMAPLVEGRYVFEKIYRFAVEGSEKTTVHVRLIYDVHRAD